MRLPFFTILLIMMTVHPGFALKLVIPVEELSNYFPEKKCQIKWDDSSLDPLRIDFTRIKEKDVISEDEKSCINTIKGCLREKGIEGIVFGRGALDSKVLIGGHVFSPADELGFVGEQGEWAPIYPGRSAILLEVTKEKGVFLVSGQDTTRSENKFEIFWEDFFKF